MVAKYLIAGAISAALAGGAVWAGADSGALGGLNSADHPHEKTAKTKAKPEADSATPRVTKRKMENASDGASSDSRSTVDRMLRPQPAEPKPTRRYETTTEDVGPSYGSGHSGMSHEDATKTSDKTKPSKSQSSTSKPSESKPSMSADDSSDSKPRRAWLDDYLKSRDSDEDASASDASRKQMDKDVRDTSPMRTTVETIEKEIELQPGDGKATSRLRIREEDGQMTIVVKKDGMMEGDEIEAFTKRFRVQDSRASGETYAILLDEAKKLEIDDMRDDAYINIIDFANANGDFKRSEALVRKLSTADLRDIARQRIGIAHAKAGHLEEAFALVDELEVTELADPIRLELIRAAAHTDKGGRHR